MARFLVPEELDKSDYYLLRFIPDAHDASGACSARCTYCCEEGMQPVSMTAKTQVQKKYHTVEEVRTTLKNMNITDEFNVYYKALYTGSSTLTDLTAVLGLPPDHQYYQAADPKK